MPKLCKLNLLNHEFYVKLVLKSYFIRKIITYFSKTKNWRI